MIERILDSIGPIVNAILLGTGALCWFAVITLVLFVWRKL